jgi:hypothetical protein
MTRAIPSKPSASGLHGLWFVFHHAGHQLALWVSSFTGKEEFYLDGSLVAERRKISLTSAHEVVAGGIKYSLKLSTRNLRRGMFECVLYENGSQVAALETEYVMHRRWEQSALAIFGTALVLFVAWKAGASFWIGITGILTVSALAYGWLGRRNGYVVRPIQSTTLMTERV